MLHYSQEDGLPKLEAYGSNWITYRDRMALMLATQNLEDHLTNAEMPRSYVETGTADEAAATARWMQDDAIAKQYIAASIPDSVFLLIKNETNAKGVWDRLKVEFENNWRMGMDRVRLERQLFNQRCGKDQNPRTHFDKLDDLRWQLDALGKSITDNEYSYILLTSLPATYDFCITSIRAAVALSEKDLDPGCIVDVVISEYYRRQWRNSEAEATPKGASPVTTRTKNKGGR